MRAIRLSNVEKKVRDAWYVAFFNAGAKSLESWRVQNLFNEILLAYHEGQRRYHNFDHISYGVSVITDHVLASGMPVRNRHAVILAYVYHDVVYDPRSKDNEAQSAVFMRRHLKSLGVPEAFIRRVARYIMYTRHSGKPIREFDGKVIVDVDLDQLAGSFKRFQENTAKIEYEYVQGGITPAQYAIGRGKFFESVLKRDHIYETPQFRKTSERKARWNLRRALDLAS